jgi:localization factor PodJL
MTAGAPWSVKGIDPKAREIAKDLARRSGMTLGEWLNQVILDDEAPVEEAPRYPTFGRQAAPSQRRFESYSRPVEDAFRMSDSLDRLSARIEAAEKRSAGAIGGIEQAVAHLMARLDGAAQDQNAIGARMEGAFDGLRAEQARAAERLRKIEQDVSESRSGEVMKALEGALAKVAVQVHDSQGRAAETFDGLRQELDGVYERLDTAFTEDAARELVEAVVARLSARLEEAERRTADALHGMEGAFAELESRLNVTEARLDDRTQELRLEALATALTDQMDAVRAEMAEAIRASAADGRFERMEQAVEEISGHVRAAEQRSAGAIEKMGHELLRMADTLTRSVQESEKRSAEAISEVSGEISRVAGDVAEVAGEISRFTESVTGSLEAAEQRSQQAIADVGERFGGEVARVADSFARGIEDVERRSTEAIERVGGEVARVADAMEARLSQADAVGAAALERLGGEIARITERLTERIANAERRSAQAIDDVGDQVARVTERLQDRQERASTDLSERIRLSEERTARLLDEARERIDQRLAETQRRLTETAPAPEAHQPLAYEAYADPAVAPFGDDTFAAPSVHAMDADPVAPELIEPDFIEPEFIEPTLADPVLAEATANPFADAGSDDDLDDAHAAILDPDAEGEALALADLDHPLTSADADPFAEDIDLMRPVHAEGEAEDFGAGLFASSETAEAEDDWFSPALAPADSDEAPERHDIEGLNGFDIPPLAASAADASEAEAPEADPFDDFDLAPRAHPAEPDSPYGFAALAPSVESAAEHEADEDDDFAALDHGRPIEPLRPLTTRELIDQARSAARSASPSHDAKARGKGKSGGSMFGGFGFGAKNEANRKKRGGSTMRTALLVSGGTAAMGVALAGYVILSDKPRGVLPDRVAVALGARPAPTPHASAGETSATPLAAVALAPKPIAAQMTAASQQAAQASLAAAAAANGPGGAELYNDAVRRIEAKDKTGVAALQKAANLGYAPAQFYLAKLYEDGQSGLTKDLVEARRWTERAAEGGDRKAMHNLALYFFEGVGGPKNLTSAAEWFRRASDLGLVDSQYNLARLYEEGFGVPQNPAEAYKWYLIAGRAGDSESRMSALRIKSQLSADAQSAAERAAQGFQPQAAQPDQTAATGAGSDVAVAQRALSKLGFYQGPTDGSASPALQLAIAAYQRGQGMPATGQLDPSLSQKFATVVQQ